MKIVFKSEEFAELNFVREYSEGFNVDDKDGISELKGEVNYRGFNSRYHRIFCSGFIFSIFEGSQDMDLIQLLESDFPYMQMHFELSTTGCLYYPDAQSEIDTEIYTGSHSLLFYPALKGKLYYLKKPESLSVEIELSLDFIRGVFDNDLEILACFGENVEKNRPAIMGNKSFPVTRAMRDIIFSIRNCTFAGRLKKVFVEAKVIELLTLQISQIQADQGKKINLRRQDIDKLHEVKIMISNHLHNPFSIEELARLAGINRTKLQEGFKELFGNTVFGYISDLRLEEARQLILDGSFTTIAEIGSLAGYKNPQHFTAAFKKKFGYLPKDIRP